MNDQTEKNAAPPTGEASALMDGLCRRPTNTDFERIDVNDKPIAWMRKWAFDGEVPHKEKRENGRMAWPTKYKMLPVTQSKCLDDDVPLVPMTVPSNV